jgi:hypothetical protein
MPETTTYKVGEDVYDIPQNEVETFLKDNPKAQKTQSYTIGSDTFDIPENEVPQFLKDVPSAKPLKKKDDSQISSKDSPTQEVSSQPSRLKFDTRTVGEKQTPIQGGLMDAVKPDLISAEDREAITLKNKDILKGRKKLDPFSNINSGVIQNDLPNFFNGDKYADYEYALTQESKRKGYRNTLIGINDIEEGGTLKKMAWGFGQGMASLPKGVLNGIEYLWDMYSMADVKDAMFKDFGVEKPKDTFDKIKDSDWYKEYENSLAAYSETLNKESLTDQWKGGDRKGAIETALIGASQSLPLTLAALIGGSGGLGVIGLMSAGTKYDSLEDSDMPIANRLLNSTITGSLEILTESVTQGYGKALTGIFGREGKKVGKEVIEKGIKSWMKQPLQRLGIYTAPLGEALSEGINGWSQYMTDVSFGIQEYDPEEAKRQFIDNAAVGLPMGSAFTIVGATGKLIKPSSKLVKENDNIKTSLIDQVQKPINEKELYLDKLLKDVPENYKETARKDITELLIKKDELQFKHDKASEKLKPVFDKQIKAVDNAIADVVNIEEGFEQDTDKKGDQLKASEARSPKKGTKTTPKDKVPVTPPEGIKIGNAILKGEDLDAYNKLSDKYGEEKAKEMILPLLGENPEAEPWSNKTATEANERILKQKEASSLQEPIQTETPEKTGLEETTPTGERIIYHQSDKQIKASEIDLKTPNKQFNTKEKPIQGFYASNSKNRVTSNKESFGEITNEYAIDKDAKIANEDKPLEIFNDYAKSKHGDKAIAEYNNNKKQLEIRVDDKLVETISDKKMDEVINPFIQKNYDVYDKGGETVILNPKVLKDISITEKEKINPQQNEPETITPSSEEVRIDQQQESQQADMGEETFESAVTRGLDRGIEWLDEVDKQLSKFGKETLGMGLPVAVAQVGVKAAKVTLQAGKTISEAVDSAINAVRESDWYKNLSPDRQKAVESDIKELFQKRPSEIKIKSDRLSGIKKELVPDEKIEDTEIERRSVEGTMNRGKKLVNDGTINPTDLIYKINADPRALQADEVAALIYYKTQLDNQFDDVYDRLEQARSANDDGAIAEQKQQLNILNIALDNYHEAALNSAYEQGLAFRMRQALMNSEYNLQSQIRKYKEANGGVIPIEIENKFEEYDRRLTELNKKIRDLEGKKSVGNAESVLKEIKESTKRKGRKRGKDLMAEGFDDLIQAIGGQTMALGEKRPDVITALSKIGMGMIDEGLATLDNVIKKIEDYVKGKKSDFDINEYKDELLDNLKSEKGISFDEDGNLVIPHSLLRDYVESGVNEIDDLVGRLKKDFGLYLSDREIRDAITKYGKTVNMNKEEIDVKIREMKRVGKILSGLEDVQKEKKKPLRSGLQRDKITDKERRLQQELREAMKDLPLTDEEVTKSWKSALDAVKARLRNQIADIQHRIETGERTPQKKGIEYDIEATELKEQRDAIKAVLDNIEGKKEMSNEQKIRISIAGIQRLADKYEERIKNKDFSAISKKSTLPQTPELTAAKQRLSNLKDVLNKMKDDMGITEQVRIDRVKSNIKKSIDRYGERLRNEDYSTRKTVKPELDQEALQLEIDRNRIKYHYDLAVETAKIKNRPMRKKVRGWVIDVFNLPKSMIASLDFSAPLRQGAILSFSHPKVAVGAFREMFAQSFSYVKSEQWIDKLWASDIYIPLKKAGLYVSEPTSKLAAKEEQFMTNLAHKIPIYGKLVSGSERAYTGYLNKLRVDVFSQGFDYLNSLGYNFQKNPEKYKALADFINNASGRGKLGMFEPLATSLNAIFFSPRLVASRINLLNPVKYAKMPKEVRKMALKDMGIFIGTGMTILALCKAAGAEVEYDPRSADFGKIRIGDLRLDIWAGFQQPIRTFVQFVTGRRKATTTGVVSKISKDVFPYDSRIDVLGSFARSKLSPSSGLVWTLIEGENILGEEVTPKMIAEGTLIPLYVNDINEIYQEEGLAIGGLASVSSLFGIGAQYYGERDVVRKGVIDGKGIDQIVKEAKTPEEKNVFNKPFSSKETKVSKQQESYMRKKYKIYKKFGMDNEHVNLLLRRGMKNEEKALYLYKNKDKGLPINTYVEYGVISNDVRTEYNKLKR